MKPPFPPTPWRSCALVGVAACVALAGAGAFSQTPQRSVLPSVQPSPQPTARPAAGVPALPNAAGLPSPLPFPQGLPSPLPFPAGVPSAVIVPPGTQGPGSAVIPGTAPGVIPDTSGVAPAPAPARGIGVAGPGVPAMTQAVPSGPGPYTALQLAQSFRQADANLDGELTRAEAQRLWIMPYSFEEMDRNKDGILTRSEYEDGVR